MINIKKDLKKIKKEKQIYYRALLEVSNPDEHLEEYSFMIYNLYLLYFLVTNIKATMHQF